MKINDVVLVEDDNNWIRRKVEELVEIIKFVVQYYVYITKGKTLLYIFIEETRVKEDNKSVPYVIANRPQRKSNNNRTIDA